MDVCELKRSGVRCSRPCLCLLAAWALRDIAVPETGEAGQHGPHLGSRNQHASGAAGPIRSDARAGRAGQGPPRSRRGRVQEVPAASYQGRGWPRYGRAEPLGQQDGIPGIKGDAELRTCLPICVRYRLPLPQ
jgi:hypothetical protein